MVFSYEASNLMIEKYFLEAASFYLLTRIVVLRFKLRQHWCNPTERLQLLSKLCQSSGAVVFICGMADMLLMLLEEAGPGSNGVI